MMRNRLGIKAGSQPLGFRVEGSGLRILLGVYWDNGKENGNYYTIGII